MDDVRDHQGHPPWGDLAGSPEDFARGALYKIFSLAFLYPSPEIAEFFGDPELPEMLLGWGGSREGDVGLAPSSARSVMRALGAYVHSAEFRRERAELASLYHAVFHIGDGVSLYESEYRCAHEFQRAKNLADLNGFYRAFGLTLIGERPDHLSVELEFMHVLALKEIHARTRGGGSDPAPAPEAESCAADRVAITRDAERRFLEDHLAVWVPAVAAAIGQRLDERGLSRRRFYGRMIGWLEQFMQSECARFGISPRDKASSLEPPSVREARIEEDFVCPFQTVCDGLSIGESRWTSHMGDASRRDER